MYTATCRHCDTGSFNKRMTMRSGQNGKHFTYNNVDTLAHLINRDTGCEEKIKLACADVSTAVLTGKMEPN